MAGIVAMLFGAEINALAFSGSNYMFSKLSGHGEAERKRHDKAIENLQKANAEWAKKRRERLDFIIQELQRERHAEKTFTEIDEAMEAYYVATDKKLPPLKSKPILSDFYHPSAQQKIMKFGL